MTCLSNEVPVTDTMPRTESAVATDVAGGGGAGTFEGWGEPVAGGFDVADACFEPALEGTGLAESIVLTAVAGTDGGPATIAESRTDAESALAPDLPHAPSTTQPANIVFLISIS
jgi:hypothetical protein